jgi:hypothetical protein
VAVVEGVREIVDKAAPVAHILVTVAVMAVLAVTYSLVGHLVLLVGVVLAVTLVMAAAQVMFVATLLQQVAAVVAAVADPILTPAQAAALEY